MVERLRKKDARMLFAELYQICGALGCNSAILDNLSAASHGLKPPHKTLLPFIDREDKSAELQDKNEKLREALGLALQYVPAISLDANVQEKINRIDNLIKEATDISTKDLSIELVEETKILDIAQHTLEFINNRIAKREISLELCRNQNQSILEGVYRGKIAELIAIKEFVIDRFKGVK